MISVQTVVLPSKKTTHTEQAREPNQRAKQPKCRALTLAPLPTNCAADSLPLD